MAASKKDAAAQKRSAAAKKAAATRKKNAAQTPQIDRQRPSTKSKGVPRSEKQANPEYQPKRAPLQAAGRDQLAEEKGRITARSAQRDEHNRRVGDASR